MAAERYVLGELEPAERDAFEEHFFDCVECSGDVRDETKIAAGIGTVEALQIAPRASRFNWWAVAASVFIASLATENTILMTRGAFTRTPPAKSEPAGAIGHPISFEADRASAGVIHIHPADSLVLHGQIPQENAHQPVYIFAVRDDDSHLTRELVRFKELDASAPILITIQPGFLASGNYTLLLRGGEHEVALSTFTLDVR
ncbi:MAG TPA: zf-HC2 domain-containing protein [Thermoanaerobaculia bacterium]|nr:zf-HC2 domain-containing protein [Thermoanaerobaculia bacterium]